MLYCFDLDGTLIRGYLTEPRQPYEVVEVLPGRVEKLHDLQERGDTIAIVTNQGGVAFGFVSETEWRAKMERACDALQLGPHTHLRAYVCFDDVRGRIPYNNPVRALRRKPSGAMIREAMGDYPDAAALGVLMVGDRPEDEAAAQDAGVAFQWAHIFFKDG